MEEEIKIPSKDDIPNVVPNCWGRVWIKPRPNKLRKRKKRTNVQNKNDNFFLRFLKK